MPTCLTAAEPRYIKKQDGDVQSHLHIPVHFRISRLCFRSDSFCRANVSAGTAFGAGRSVDNVNIAGRNSPYRAFVNAGAAGNAFVGIDFVSHE